MNNRIFFHRTESPSGEMVAFASLGIAGVAMILFALSSIAGIVAGPAPEVRHNESVATCAALQASSTHAVIFDDRRRASR